MVAPPMTKYLVSEMSKNLRKLCMFVIIRDTWSVIKAPVGTAPALKSIQHAADWYKDDLGMDLLKGQLVSLQKSLTLQRTV